MKTWIVATATTAALSAVGVGAALEARPGAQDLAGSGHAEIADLLPPEAEQDVRIFGGAGSQVGMSIRDLNDEELKGGKTSTGVVVEDVQADSPALKAGFKASDIVTEFDGERVRSTRQFIRLVQETSPGRSITASVTRDGQKVTLTVQPRAGGPFKYWDGSADAFLALPAPKMTPPMVFKRDGFPPSLESFLGPSGQLGISVDEISPQLAEYFAAKEGVLVTSVKDNTNASRAGLKAGDVITALNGGAVSSAVDLRRRAQRLEGGDEFTLAIVREKKAMTLKGRIEPAQERRSSARTTV